MAAIKNQAIQYLALDMHQATTVSPVRIENGTIRMQPASHYGDVGLPCVTEVGPVRLRFGSRAAYLVAEGVRAGMVPAEVRAVTGEPSEVTLHYSVRDEDTHYRQRSVHLTGGRVSKITAGIYID